MKKIFYLCLLMLVFPVVTKAASFDLSKSTCSTDTTTGIETCNIILEVTGVLNGNKVNIPYELNNLTFESATASSDWVYNGNSSSILSFTKKEGTTLSGVYQIGTVTFKKVKMAEVCNVSFKSPSFDSIKRSCEIIDNVYYDKDGLITDEINYKKVCEKPSCFIYPDGTYSNKAGEIVDKDAYDKECNSHVCEIIDGKYYGKDGNVTTKEKYNNECSEKLVCQEKNGKYYGSNGEIVDKDTYDKECNSHICEVVDGKYYGKSGEVVSKQEYDNMCGVIPENPKTGAGIGLIIIGTSLVISGGIIYISKRRENLFKI